MFDPDDRHLVVRAGSVQLTVKRRERREEEAGPIAGCW
jgi:hypothetical protein